MKRVSGSGASIWLLFLLAHFHKKKKDVLLSTYRRVLKKELVMMMNVVIDIFAVDSCTLSVLCCFSGVLMAKEFFRKK